MATIDQNSLTPLTLISRDGGSFSLPRRYLFVSGFVVSALEADPKATEFQVDLSSEVLTKIVEYLNDHKGVESPYIEKPLRSRELFDVCSNANDVHFIEDITEENVQLLYDVVMGALYLHIPGLLHLGCAKIASMIKGQPLDRIKQILVPRKTT